MKDYRVLINKARIYFYVDDGKPFSDGGSEQCENCGTDIWMSDPHFISGWLVCGNCGCEYRAQEE